MRTARALRAAGVLGLNTRNADYILPVNHRRNYPLVDDKLKTKTLAAEHGLNTPELYATIRYGAETRMLADLAARHQDFVVKPASGSGGDGIIVVKGRIGDSLRLADRSTMSLEELAYHIKIALTGVFSLGGQPDKVLIEYCVQFDPVFEPIAFQGVPDIRIIAYKGVPVMAMVRLPTRQSGGKANLHQGAIGAGIDLASGRTLTAVHRNGVVDTHPDTHARVTGVEIPRFDRMLEIASRCNAMTGLGYVGVDLVIDRELGPLMLELNARPGLAIQIANRTGLGLRLRAVDEQRVYERPQAERIEFARTHFAAT
ncbi:MAG: alpha-L-glutamate ligase-like protein [Burkholderiaceae bacterium]|nr:alpha-L-glutamate ligase-like protein [Burkholderiaceae bacterium]